MAVSFASLSATSAHLDQDQVRTSGLAVGAEAPIHPGSNGSSFQKFVAEQSLSVISSQSVAKEKFNQFLLDLIGKINKGNKTEIRLLLNNMPPCPLGMEEDYSDCLGSLAAALTFQDFPDEAFELIRQMPAQDKFDFRSVAVSRILSTLIKKHQIDAAFKFVEMASKEGLETQDEMLDHVYGTICLTLYMEKQFDLLGQRLDSIPSERFSQKSHMWFFMPLFLASVGRADRIPAFIQRIDGECMSIACRMLLEAGFLQEAELLWKQVQDPAELHQIQVAHCAALACSGREDEAFQLIEKMPDKAKYEERPELGSVKESALVTMFSHLFQKGLKDKAFFLLNNRITSQAMKMACFEFACQKLAEKGEISEAFELAAQSLDPLNIDRVTDRICCMGTEADLEVLEKLLSLEKDGEELRAQVAEELSFARGQIEDLLIQAGKEAAPMDHFCEAFVRSLERRCCGKILHAS